MMKKKNKNTNVNYIGEYYCKVSVHKTGNITNMLIKNMSKLWKKRINYSMFKIKDRNNISYEQISNNNNNNNKNLKLIDLNTIRNINFIYNHDLARTENERNMLVIDSEKDETNIVYKIFTSNDKDMTRFEKYFRNNNIDNTNITNDIINTKQILNGKIRQYDNGIYGSISSPLSITTTNNNNTSKHNVKKAKSLSTVHICKVELPDNSGIIDIPIEDSTLFALYNLKQQIFIEIQQLIVKKNGESNYKQQQPVASNYVATEVINPLILLQQQQEAQQEAQQEENKSAIEKLNIHPNVKLQNIIDNGEDAYIFRYQIDINNDFIDSDHPNSWLIDEKSTLEHISNTGTGTLYLSLVHCSELPFGLTFCNMNIIKTIDVFKKPCLRHELHIFHSSLNWKILYHSNHFKQFHEKLCKKFNEYCEIHPSEKIVTLPSLTKDNNNNGIKTYQKYMNALLRHSWASGSVELLEFIGVVNASRANEDGKQVIHISQLKHFVNVGDIICFKCSDMSGGFTRMAINSEYDHIGVVVRDSHMSGLKILEASSAEGVNTYSLLGRLRGYYLAGYVDKIAIRRLKNFTIKESKMDAGIEFLKTIKGNAYSFSLLEYFKNVSNGFTTKDGVNSNNEVENNNSSQQQKTVVYDQNSNYFCSEVVVTYLSIIGAIDTNGLKHSTFLPNHFMPGGSVEEYLCSSGGGGKSGDGGGEEKIIMEDLVLLDCRVLELTNAKETGGGEEDEVDNDDEEEEVVM